MFAASQDALFIQTGSEHALANLSSLENDVRKYIFHDSGSTDKIITFTVNFCKNLDTTPVHNTRNNP